MKELDHETSQGRRLWQLDRAALDALLQMMAPDRDAAGQKYEELRRRLINLFNWERCEAPDDLADEVLNRLARKALEGVEIPNVDRFALGIAKFVIQEDGRKRRNHQAVLRQISAEVRPGGGGSQQIEDVEACLAALPADRREFIQRYYLEDRNALAQALGISMNALRNRAFRIREDLFQCAMRKRDNS